jgi:3-phosphoglycerate kinase
MEKLTVKDVSLKDKNVLMRVDFNVPLDDDLNITDDTRIRATLPTIKYILEKEPKRLILMSHLGRPEGKRDPKYSLRPVKERLEELLGEKVKFLDDCVGEKVKKEIENAKEKVILLENLRFHPEEEKNEPNFAKELASLADIFVNDAFGTAHRAHASTEGVTHYLTSVAGFLLEKEIQYLGKALENPLRPFVVILGGAKVSDKIGVINNLLPKCDCLLIGGGMAYTFLYAQGKNIGNSKLEKDKVDLAKEILEKAKKLNKELVLPIDHLVVDKIEAGQKSKIVEDIPEGKIAVDIGPKTIEEFKKRLKTSKTIVWNGPLGVFEIDDFSKGTYEIASFIAGLLATTIIGGGDTASAIAKFKLEDKMTHISTGGGASLEFMEGKVLPGIEALTDK